MWIIHYHGNSTNKKFTLNELSPIGVYEGINFIGTLDALTFDRVEKYIPSMEYQELETSEVNHDV